jgi:hypothetical protein
MKMNAAYEMRDGYLYVRVTGEYNEVEAREILLEWTAVMRNHYLNRVVYDTTLVTGFDAESQSVITSFKTSELVAQLVPRSVRLAFLQSPNRLRKDRFDENVMFNRGVMVRVTSDLQDAIEWLGTDSPYISDSGDE